MFESFFNGLKDIVLQVFEAIWSIFFDSETGLVWWIFETFLSFGEWCLLGLIDVLGMNNLLSQYSGVIAEAFLLCSKLNKFVPLVESVELFFIFVSFLSLIVSIRIILKFIPGLG
jgi:hypothetical protein